MKLATKEFLASLDALAQKRKEEIRSTADEVTVTGTAYYVSNQGDDANDGRTPATAWRTLACVTEAELLPGNNGRSQSTM